MRTVAVLFLCGILFFSGIGATSLWDPDEPRQAIMAREMMERGDYIHPYLNGMPYLEKPPFHPWLIILGAKLRGGLDETAARLPSAVTATLLVVLIFSLGTMLSDKTGGFLSALMAMTNYQFLSNARESVMDMTFAFFIGLAIYLYYVSLTKKKYFLIVLSATAMACAVLTKGPAGIVLPVGVIFIYTIVTKRFRESVVPLFLACVLASALAGVWFMLAGEEYFKEFILRQNFTRYMNAFDHQESLFYYFPKLFFNFLPWSLLLPFALYWSCRRKLWVPFIWFVLIFLFFTASTSKRAIYLLPLYPAAALLCGLFLREKGEALLQKDWFRITAYIFGFLFAAIPVLSVIVTLFVLPATPKPQLAFTTTAAFYILMTLLLLAGVAQIVLVRLNSPKGAMTALFIYVFFLGFFHNNYYMPSMDKEQKSPLRIVEPARELAEGRTIYTHVLASPGVLYYFGRPIGATLDFNNLSRGRRGILLLVEENLLIPEKEKLLAMHYRDAGRVRYQNEYIRFYTEKDGK